MTSWIMRFWLESHDESEWPDLTICQTEVACHVTDMRSRPSKEVIEKMYSYEFFANHKYKHVDVPSVTVRDDEDDDYSFFSKAGNSEANESLYIISDYEAADISPNPVERDHKFMAVNQEPREPDSNESGYLSSIAMEAEPRSDTEHRSSNQSTTEGFGSNRSHTEIYQAEVFSRTAHEATFSQATKIKKRVVEYNKSAFSSDQDEASWDEDTESIRNYDTPIVASENAVYILDQSHTSQGEGTRFIPKQEACLVENEAMDSDSSACFYQNAAFWTCTHPTVPDQLVPRGDHLYANMQEKLDGVTGTRSLQGMETGQPHMEARYQEHETSPQLNHALQDIASNNSAGPLRSLASAVGFLKRNPRASLLEIDPKLKVTFYV